MLGKGMLTLPKKWRDALGISQGSLLKASFNGATVTLQPIRMDDTDAPPYRIYSEQDINEFLVNDAVSDKLQKKAEKLISRQRSSRASGK